MYAKTYNPYKYHILHCFEFCYTRSSTVELYICRNTCVGNGPANMLTVKSSSGVAQEADQREHLLCSPSQCKSGRIHFKEKEGDITRNPKQGVPLNLKKGHEYVSTKKHERKIVFYLTTLNFFQTVDTQM